jgi:penicillin-binding protein 1C
MLAGPYCESDTTWIPESSAGSGVCTYHQLLHLDASRQWQVSSDCESPAQMQHVPWFVLPPEEEFYFKSKNPWYETPPPFRPDCADVRQTPGAAPMQLLYPKNFTRIYVPVDLDGKLGSTIFQAAHRDAGMEVFWHLDGVYLGSTKVFHQISLQPAVGTHHLALVDRNGFRIERTFEIVGKER